MYAVIDIETTGLNRFEDKINYVGFAIYENDGVTYCIFSSQYDNFYICVTDCINTLRTNKAKLIFQNGKFDTLFLQAKGFPLLPIHHDIMLMGTAYDQVAKHSLKEMAKNYLGVDDWDISKKEKTSSGKVVEEYLKKDLQYTWELFQYFSKNMTDKQQFLYKNLLKPAYLMYRKAEQKGIYIDQEKLKKVKVQYAQKEQETLYKLETLYKINWNSSKQVADVLYNVEKLPTLKLSEKTGDPSSDSKVLKKLASKGYELPKLLLDYKFYFGANSKFLNSWGDYARHTGRIHPSFKLTSVVTGRTSCSDPNLQQVPRNPELRTLFTAPSGKIFIEADYSQVELRIAADFAKETTMINIYKNRGDIHTETAQVVTGKKEVTKEDRSKAKAVNFGFLYGMQAKSFSEYAFDSYGVIITPQEAEDYRNLFFKKYPRLLDWYKEVECMCEANGGVYNYFGRFIALPDIYNSNKFERGKAVRKAINAPVQGTASDLLLVSAVEIYNKLNKEIDLHIVGTVHDSILFEVPEEYQDIATTEIKRIMEKPQALELFNINLSVPIEADIGIGAWGSK